MEINKRKIVILGMLCMLVQLFAQGPNNSGIYYQKADGKKASSLKTVLHEIINPHKVISYKGLWEAFKTSDRRSDGKVWDMYSCVTNYDFDTDQDGGNHKKEGDTYNREHSFPKSWFNDASPMYSDLVHLVPTDSYINGMRSNYPFGETANPNKTSINGYSKLGPSSVSGYSGTVFEPNDDYKGDFARIYFYMATCYEDKISNWNSDMLSGDSYKAYAPWAMEMLMRWAAADPVSQKEIDRNNAVYSLQNNRNPFVDFPGLEQYIWGNMTQSPFSYDNYARPDGGTTPDPDPDPDPIPDDNVYVKITSDADITIGESYLIVYEAYESDKSKALSKQDGSIRSSVNVSVDASGTIQTETGKEGLPYTLTIDGQRGAYTLYDSTDKTYLSYTGSKNHLLSVEKVTGTTEQWNISFDQGNAIITNVANDMRQIYYNVGSPRFACYSSRQASVSLYKRKQSTSISRPSADSADKAVDVYSVTGVMVRHDVSFNSALEGLSRGIYIIDGKKYVVN